MLRKIQAGKFKAQCLALMDQVNKTKQPILITKHHRPVAKLVPVKEEETQLLGHLKGTMQITGDILKPIDEVWNADS